MIHLNIGSNLKSKHGSRFKNIALAIRLLKEAKVKIKKISSFYETPSYPNKNLPKYVNIGLLVNYRSHTDKLVKEISIIEKKLGRIRSKKNDPRVCDIDIIDFKGLKVKNKSLILPHPRCFSRNFVLYPIQEIDPKWIHPIFRKNVDFLISKLNHKARIEITRLRKSVII